ncbi:hypothetical protein [Flavobacterium succinicans]|nr:hypothetical protein [Flavobacterium succinicans]
MHQPSPDGSENPLARVAIFLRVGKSDPRSSFATQQKKPTETEIVTYSRIKLLKSSVMEEFALRLRSG